MTSGTVANVATAATWRPPLGWQIDVCQHASPACWLLAIGELPAGPLGRERHSEELGEGHVVRCLIGWYPNGNLLWRGIAPQGPMQPVPDGQPARPVGIRLLGHDGMMDGV